MKLFSSPASSFFIRSMFIEQKQIDEKYIKINDENRRRIHDLSYPTIAVDCFLISLSLFPFFFRFN